MCVKSGFKQGKRKLAKNMLKEGKPGGQKITKLWETTRGLASVTNQFFLKWGSNYLHVME